MTRPDVRVAVDAAIRRHLDGRLSLPPAPGSRPVAALPADDAGHGRFLRAELPGDPPQGRCVIEPAVECTGCGYCRTQGY